ncbi:MAG: cupin domain-containing protein [Actinobacteria bacterium]|nr:cupin domain-containing protein [Actinomycetota bacterium]
MKIKKFKDSGGRIMEDSQMSGIRFHPMLTASDGTPSFAMRVFEISPGGYTPLHEHDWEHEVYVISGSGSVVGKEKETPVEKGDFILVMPMETHQFRAGREGMSMICAVPNRGQK